ncbi:MAG: MFS transporter [Desulfococcus sp.]|nr:MAG: MFS transporter [Desulfococcus sp.]
MSSSKWPAFFCVAAGVFMSTLDGSIVNVTLPVIMRDLETDFVTVEWVMMAYLLTVSALLMAFGRLSDITGRRRMYVCGLFVFSLSSLFCGLSVSIAQLVLSRIAQGVGAAMIMSCTQAIIAGAFPASERGKALGMLGAVVASGLTTGPAVGGWLMDMFSWHAIFIVNVPAGFLVICLSLRMLPPIHHPDMKGLPFDLQGAFFMAAGMTALLMLATHAAQWGTDHWATRGFLLCLAVSLAGLIRDTLTAPHPFLAPVLLKTRLFLLPVISAMIMFMSLFALIFLMPFYLMHPCGYPERETGLIMVTPFACFFVFAPLSGVLYDRLGSRGLCTVGMILLTGAFYALAHLPPAPDLTDIICRLAMAGTGMAVFTAPNNAAVMSSVPPQFMGTASGTVATMRNLGMVLGIAFTGAVFNAVFTDLSGGRQFHGWRPELMSVFMASFYYAMLSAAAVGLVGTAITFLRGPDGKCRK